MSLVVVERSFEQPVAFDQVAAWESAISGCLELYRVEYRVSYFARDRSRMICVYEAPDAEAVRFTQREGNLPFDHVWPGKVLLGELPLRAAPLETVVVQREQAQQPCPDRRARADECMRRHRTERMTSLLSLDQKRQICVFSSVDAESVRTIQRELELPAAAIWSCTVHAPE